MFVTFRLTCEGTLDFGVSFFPERSMIRSFCGFVVLGMILSFVSGCDGGVSQSDAKMEGEPPKVDAKAKFAPPKGE